MTIAVDKDVKPQTKANIILDSFNLFSIIIQLYLTVLIFFQHYFLALLDSVNIYNIIFQRYLTVLIYATLLFNFTGEDRSPYW